MVGINWSVGKTSCRTIIHQTLNEFITDKKIYTSPRNFNWELGLPLSIFALEEWEPSIWYFVKTFFQTLYLSFFGAKKYDVIILEYWIDRPMEMEFLLNIVKPNIWVFTALDAVHSQQFGDPNAIAKEEVKMPLNTLELVFLNHDEDYTHQITNKIEIDKITYHTMGHDKKADICFENEKFIQEKDNIKTSFDLSIKGKFFNISTNLVGKSNYWYIGVALSIAETINYKFHQKELFKNKEKLVLDYQLLAGRLSIFPGVHDCILIDSTYNASPLSMRRIIDTTHWIKNTFKKKKDVWLVLWDMRELGDFAEQEHRKLAGYCIWLADKIFLVWELMEKCFMDELSKIWFNMNNVLHHQSSTKLWKILKKEIWENKNECIVMIKWSQNTIFLEETTKALLKNKKDISNLVRQWDFWMEKKNTK